MTQDEMITALKAEVKLTSYLTDPDDYENAIADALREVGTSFPVTDDNLLLWAKKRSKRHLYSYLLSQSAHKFKYEQINLQQRFEHYRVLVNDMDKEFESVKDQLFASADAYKLFGTKIDAGFAYDEVGSDETYSDSNEVNFFPNENS